jgi:ABC-2 type transport system permease protein
MRRLVHTELLKQRTTRTFVFGIALAPVIGALVTFANYSVAGKQGNEPLGQHSFVQALGAPASVITLIALLLGVLGMAGEYRHHTVTTTFLATPRRGRVVVAKLVAHGLVGALMGLGALAAAGLVAVPWLASSDVTVDVDRDAVRVVVGMVVAPALYAALGVSVGALVRNQTTAIGAVLVWLLAIEGIIGDVFHSSAFVGWLPSAAGGDLTHVGGGHPDLAMPVAGVALLAYVLAFGFLGVRLTARRDIT